jgi:hypothetical protein
MADPNIELLEKTYAFIEAHPEHWQQTMWRCKTGMCFAGWAAELAGGKWLTGPASDEGDGKNLLATEDYLVPEPEEAEYTRTLFVKGDAVEGMHVEDRAMRVLGIDNDDAEELFDGCNDLPDIRKAIDSIKERATNG